MNLTPNHFTEKQLKDLLILLEPHKEEPKYKQTYLFITEWLK